MNRVGGARALPQASANMGLSFLFFGCKDESVYFTGSRPAHYPAHLLNTANCLLKVYYIFARIVRVQLADLIEIHAGQFKVPVPSQIIKTY